MYVCVWYVCCVCVMGGWGCVGGGVCTHSASTAPVLSFSFSSSFCFGFFLSTYVMFNSYKSNVAKFLNSNPEADVGYSHHVLGIS